MVQGYGRYWFGLDDKLCNFAGGKIDQFLDLIAHGNDQQIPEVFQQIGIKFFHIMAAIINIAQKIKHHMNICVQN